MQQTLTRVCVALGANLGDARTTVRQAIQAIGAMAQTQCIVASSLYVSAPYEAFGPEFINAVALYDTGLAPWDFLQALQSLEDAAGRTRPFQNAPRTLDLDVIFYGDLVMDSARLTLPHPRWQERAFVLVPLAEISPHQVTSTMLAKVQDQTITRIQD